MSEPSKSNPEELSPDLLARIQRVGEACRDIDDEAQRNDAAVVAQALLVLETDNDESAADTEPTSNG